MLALRAVDDDGEEVEPVVRCVSVVKYGVLGQDLLKDDGFGFMVDVC